MVTNSGAGADLPEKPLLDQERAITLGHPSYVWGFGQERRLNLIHQYAPLEGRVILDVGCGMGMYVRAFHRFSHSVHGVDIDPERVTVAGQELPNICLASVEQLPYRPDSFDVILSHEVIEHVGNDRQAIVAAVAALRRPEPAKDRAGGRLVIFAPNRLYPFETHGVFWRGRYRFGNIPLVNYLPNRWRSLLCPHVRAYSRNDLRRLLADLPVKIVVHTQIYPGYDKIVHRRPALGRALRMVTYVLEHTPLRAFGLSHLLVVEKIA